MRNVASAIANDRGEEESRLLAKPSISNTCVVVITFNPDELFEWRLERTAAQFTHIVIVDNGSIGKSLDMVLGLRGRGSLSLISNEKNLGIAVALNQGVRVALEMGFHWAVTLDQDTVPLPHMLQTLLAAYDSLSTPEVIVGGNYFDVHRRRLRLAGIKKSECIKKKTLITSGMLVPLAFCLREGGFREDYFIDSVDHEFCLRVRSLGWGIYMTREAVMEHRIGSKIIAPRWISNIIPFNHSPVRKYYMARNMVATIRLYSLKEPLWSIRQIVRLFFEFSSIFLIESDKKSKALAFIKGIKHGMIGRLGPADKA
jgi:rhamnosyltransferase